MKICKKLLIIFISVMLILCTTQCVVSQAVGEDGEGDKSGGTSDIYGSIKEMATTEAAGGEGAVTSARNIAGSVISVAKVICAGIAIIMLSVIAMKYMLAAPSEKADIKKHAVVYVVGAVVMFAATGILEIIQSFASVLEQGE